MSKRARYYDPATGEFISRDPLEYVDGMSLYRGHFAPANLDPHGEFVVRPQDLGPKTKPVKKCSVDSCIRKCSNLPEEIWYPTGPTRPKSACISRCRSIHKKFTDWYANESNMAWLNELLPCPCKKPGKWIRIYIGNGITKSQFCPDDDWYEDPAETFWVLVWVATGTSDFHPGSQNCFRSRKTKSGHSQQCCYDSKGNLVTHGPGAGTPDKNIPNHPESDVEPWEWAKELGCLDKYLERRPPNNSNNCTKNP